VSSFFLPAAGYSRYHGRQNRAIWRSGDRVSRGPDVSCSSDILIDRSPDSGLIRHSLENQVVTVQLNGEPREVPEGLTLAALIEWLKLPHDRVAVERNLEIVPRARWNVTPIQAGDQLEVVHLVGGGL
jgi:sulfur carrier protein